ncbi:hypothetical protein WM41_0262 [Corynebacterium simulans]|uniref:Uncharacterized protein n=1 Tax=Corynebacterium simulans TaxID=146827 RepID=A0ABR5VC07_9CORY|nr:hypothetical protein WM41_0262 [Corynebacterium simulans]
MNQRCLNERGVVCPVEVFNEIVEESWDLYRRRGTKAASMG